MCGIFALLDLDPASAPHGDLRRQVIAQAKKLRHRGPDWSGVFADDRAILAHERLAIVDVEHGAQPLIDVRRAPCWRSTARSTTIARCGRAQSDHAFQTDSDCEPILYLYDEESPRTFLERMNGIFAFVLHDPRRNTYLIARDPIGVVPLYVGWDRQERLYVASEMKALVDVCERIKEFPPGHYFLGHEASKGFQRYYTPTWAAQGTRPAAVFDPAKLRDALEAAVHRQLMTDVPYGVLISGGIDSSIIAAITARFSQRRVESGDNEPAWWPRLHSFAIGLEGAPDLAPAKRVADHIGSVHHELHFTVQEGLDALSDVIYHLETFDITTIRASTPMYLLMRKVRAMGIKMVLSGEGADEISAATSTFTRPRTGRSCTPRRCASSRSCTFTTAPAPTSPAPPGASRPACPISIGSSSRWRWR